ncbi:MAG: ribosomal protein S18-alanine N-acetyltransferase [Nitrospirota bacterium]
MRDSDITEVVTIERVLFSTPWSEKAFFKEIHSPYSITKVATVGNNVVGYVCGNCLIDEGHLLNLAVHPDFRRQGIGTALVEEVLIELKKRGCKYLYLEVRVSNVSARTFYEHLKFRVVGVRRNYYTLPTEDALVMMLEL